MTGWIVIGCILLFLILIGQIRIGVKVDFSEAGLFLNVKVGPFQFRVLPAGEQKAKKAKATKTVEQTDGAVTDKKKRVKDTLSLALRFVPPLGEAAGRLKRKIRIDHLLLHVVWGADDPAAAAMGYGAGNAAIGILWPVVDNNFKVKEHDLQVDVDFERATPALSAMAQATLTVGQSLKLALILGFKALNIFLGYRREQKEQKAVQS